MGHRLLLVRHAKSSWDDPSLADWERPLAPRGVAALPMMCRHLEKSGTSPDLVLCSPAQRTIATLEGLRPALGDAARVEVRDEIYDAGTAGLLAMLHAIDETTRVVMVVGHNPGLQQLALVLDGEGDMGIRHQLWEKFPTGAIASIATTAPWSGLAPGTGHLTDLFLPRRPHL